MNIVRLASRQLAARPLHTGLNVLLLALGIATISLLMLFNAQMQDKLISTARGIDLVVGAKGSPLQLMLSTIYHADIPTGNIPKAEADKLALNPLVEKTIPMSLGDNLMGHRIVGTTHDYAALYGGTLASGRLWNASMEATVGANVAKLAKLTVGQTFAGSHGLSAGGEVHEDHRYHVVGIFAPTGTILDDLVLTGLQSVWDLHEHEAAEHASSGQKDETPDFDPNPHEITALLVKYKTPLAVLALPRMINANTNLQAASPAMESVRLLNVVGFGVQAFRAFAVILIVSAALSVFVALYTTLKERRFDLAVMRMLGSSRKRLFTAILLEGLLLSVASAALGLLAGHLVVEFAGREGLTPGLTLTGWYWVSDEWWLTLLALGVGLVASFIPAMQAYRTEIATVLSER